MRLTSVRVEARSDLWSDETLQWSVSSGETGGAQRRFRRFPIAARAATRLTLARSGGV